MYHRKIVRQVGYLPELHENYSLPNMLKYMERKYETILQEIGW